MYIYVIAVDGSEFALEIMQSLRLSNLRHRYSVKIDKTALCFLEKVCNEGV